MKIKEVQSISDVNDFLKIHIRCNQSDPNWIQPLNKDIKQVFDPSKNKAFRFGEATRWILRNDNGELIGRIAAFVNKKYKNKGDTFPVGGIGFFDSIDDQEAANLLFDKAKHWLIQRGVSAMDGPINFGERDKWWGLLTEGFDEPLYGMNYNPPYYSKLFENYGFRVFYNQICWTLPVASSIGQLQTKFYDAHKKFIADSDYKALPLQKDNLERCITDFCTVYNKAWAKHEGNKEMSLDQARVIFKSLKPVLDPALVWFAYYKNEPIAMWISIPDINQIFKYLHGKFNLISKLKFLYYRKRGACDRFVGIIFGIVPEHQGTGIDYFMIVEAEKYIKKFTSYRKTELLWQGDFNPKMLNISKALGGVHSRTLVTYRYMLDPNIPFHRHPVLN